MASWLKIGFLLLSGSVQNAFADRYIDHDGASLPGCTSMSGQTTRFTMSHLDYDTKDGCLMGNGETLNVCSDEKGKKVGKPQGAQYNHGSLGISEEGKTYLKKGVYNQNCEKNNRITLLKDILLPPGIRLDFLRLKKNGHLYDVTTGEIVMMLDKKDYYVGRPPLGFLKVSVSAQPDSPTFDARSRHVNPRKLR